MIIGYLPMFPRPPVGAWYPFMAAELYPLPLLWGVDPLEPYPLGERLEPWPLVYPATSIDIHLPKLKNIRSEFLFIIIQVLTLHILQYNVIIIECLVCPPNTRQLCLLGFSITTSIVLIQNILRFSRNTLVYL